LRIPGVIGLLGDMFRPGVTYLQRYLELVHFPMRTPVNDLLECFHLKWQGLDWALTCYPRAILSWSDLNRALESAGLRADRVHIHSGGGGTKLDGSSVPSGQQFLFSHGFVELDLPMDRILVLTNVPGSLVYRDPRAAEREIAQKMRDLEARYLPPGVQGVADL
jgi:hypothetical protein